MADTPPPLSTSPTVSDTIGVYPLYYDRGWNLTNGANSPWHEIGATLSPSARFLWNGRPNIHTFPSATGRSANTEPSYLKNRYPERHPGPHELCCTRIKMSLKTGRPKILPNISPKAAMKFNGWLYSWCEVLAESINDLKGPRRND